MWRISKWKGGAGNVVKAEAAERYRKRRGDTDRYYTSKRDVEDEKEVDKGRSADSTRKVCERMRATPEGMITQNGCEEIKL